MKPIKFKQANVTFAENQPEYLPLPAYYDKHSGDMWSCWKLSLAERIYMLFTGKVWVGVKTFGNPLQPLLPTAELPTESKSMWTAMSLDDRLAAIALAPASILLIHLYSRFLDWLHIWRWVQIILLLISFFIFPWFLVKAYKCATKSK